MRSKQKFPCCSGGWKNWENNGNFMIGRNWVKFLSRTGVQQSTIPVGGIDYWDDEKHALFTEIAPLMV